MKLQQLAVLLDQSTLNRSYQRIEGQKLDRSRCKLSHSHIFHGKGAKNQKIELIVNCLSAGILRLNTVSRT